MDDRERNLEAAVDDLAETLEALRAELRNPPRGPLGLPRLPTPGEFLRVTEQHALPTLVSLLETNIRVLELLAATIRLAEGRPPSGDTGRRRGADTDGAERLAAASRRTLRKLDDALAELQSAAAGGDPSSPEVRRLLQEARGLRQEVDERLADATTTSRDESDESEPTRIEIRSGDPGRDTDDVEGADERADERGSETPGGDGDTRAGRVDVDQELESIKRELGDDGATDDSEGTDDGGDTDGSGGTTDSEGTDDDGTPTT